MISRSLEHPLRPECVTAEGVVTRCGVDSLEIELAVPEGCRGCSGLCAWRRLPTRQRIALPPVPDLAVGDAVVVALPERALLEAALCTHGLPLAALLAGAAAGAWLLGSDAGAVAGAIAAVVAAVYAGRRLRARIERAALAHLRVSRS